MLASPLYLHLPPPPKLSRKARLPAEDNLKCSAAPTAFSHRCGAFLCQSCGYVNVSRTFWGKITLRGLIVMGWIHLPYFYCVIADKCSLKEEA